MEEYEILDIILVPYDESWDDDDEHQPTEFIED